jgi:peptidase A4-like protein
MRKIVRLAGAAAVCALVQGSAVAVTAAQVSHRVLNAPAHLRVRNDAVKSTNWSGYAVQRTKGTKFTDVAGSWVEPAVTCAGGDQYSAFWVGIDGYVSDSVEQLGTSSNCDGTTPKYNSWWEMYPAEPVSLPVKKYPVEAGDTLTASVSVTADVYTLSISSSRGWSFSTATTGSSSLRQSSAEWITEAPTSTAVLPLADFGTVGFTNCTAALSRAASEPISSFTAKSGPHEITMAAKGTTKAAPSALNSSGNGFTVTWEHA